MKTIDEAAKEIDKVVNGKLSTAFKSGVAFAQRWIPIEEELPENFSSVIVRDNGQSPVRSIALFQDHKFYPDFLLESHQVTHWRPIELK
jgi:hypothetical protein